MQVTPVKIEVPRLGSGLERSDTLHISSVVSDFLLTLKIRKPYDDPQNAKDEWRREFGFLWEDAFAQVLGARYNIVRPPELELDGITMSADGWELDENGTYRLIEYKATWKSSRDFDPSKNEYWRMVAGGYIRAGRQFLDPNIDTIRYFVFFVNDDYSRPMAPTMGCWDVKFSARDLDENWTQIRNHAKFMLSKKGR